MYFIKGGFIFGFYVYDIYSLFVLLLYSRSIWDTLNDLFQSLVIHFIFVRFILI